MAVKRTMKKRTRNFAKTRAHILEVAFWEVYTHGFQGVSVDDIVKRTRLTKGAFYHHFPTKTDLGYALIDDVIKPMIIDRWIKPLEEYDNPIEGILKQIKKHIGGPKIEELKYGCPLNNLVQEMAPIDEGFRVRLKTALNLWIDETEKHLKRAQRKGFLAPHIKPRQLAKFVVMAHEGFYGIIKGLGEKSAFDALYSSLEQYFASLSVRK